MLTIQSGYRYTKSLKTTNTAFNTPSACLFYALLAWMRAGNTQYRPKHLLVAFSESTPLLILNGDFLRKTNKMTNAISIFKFNQNQIRTQAINGNPWFCLADCCKALGIKQNRDTATRLSQAGVGKTDISHPTGKKQITIINEPNLYRLIFRSNKPQAQAFADWVYSEVLPQIRQTGGYGTHLRQELSALASASAADTDTQDMRNLIAALMNNIIDGRVKNQYRHLVDEIATLRTKLDTIRKTIA